MSHPFKISVLTYMMLKEFPDTYGTERERETESERERDREKLVRDQEDWAFRPAGSKGSEHSLHTCIYRCIHYIVLYLDSHLTSLHCKPHNNYMRAFASLTSAHDIYAFK